MTIQKDAPYSMGPKSEFLGIQALRCLAAVLVVIAHATDVWADHANTSPRPATWGNGTAGVDIFFVISGFVMMISSSKLRERKNAALLFLWRRFARIVPLYWLLTSLKVVAIKLKPDLAMHAPPSTWNICASYLFLPSYSSYGDIRPVVTVGWTLNFEMLFYVLFALALALHIRVLYLLIPVLGLLSLGAYYRSPNAPAITAFADPIVLDFIAGVLIALFIREIQSVSVGLMALAGCIGILGILTYVPDSSTSFMRIIVYGGGAAVVVTATIACEPYLAKLLSRWILLLGDASYSIYLIQGFALPIAATILIRAGVFSGRMPTRWAELCCVALGTTVTIILAIPVYKLIEHPMMMTLKRVKV